MSNYQYITQYTSPNQTPGRPYGIGYIVIHWWGDPNTHPTFDGVVNTLCNTNRQASAHYVVEAGKVACIVDPDNRAWHAGDGIGVHSKGNDCGIGIELNPRQSDGDYNTAAELIRELRATYGDLPLMPHKACTATQCPGTYDLGKLDRLARGQQTPTQQVLQPQPQQAPRVLVSRYRCVVDALNVRDKPNTHSNVVAVYNRGQSVILDGWSTIADGYIWARYTSYSGHTRYIAVGTADGTQTYLQA